MKRENVLGAILKCAPFLCMLGLYVTLLYRDITVTADILDRGIRILAHALTISAILGELGSLLVIDRFNLLLTGKASNFVDDIREESSQDIAVRYNGLVASALICPAIIGLYALYLYTQEPMLMKLSTLTAIVFAIGTTVYILAVYVKAKSEGPTPFSKLSDPVFLPAFLSFVQLLITQTKPVGAVYRAIYQPRSDVCLTVALMIVLCYLPVTAFCHYSNLYCLLGFAFLKKDPGKIQAELTRLREQEELREDTLRQATRSIDEQGETAALIKKLALTGRFFHVHLKTYLSDRFYAAVYLWAVVKLKITQRLKGLLAPERIRINAIRFCAVTVVLELLVLDLLLFIRLDGDAPCLKFFELLSTVIIIPVLLSWLAELKVTKE